MTNYIFDNAAEREAAVRFSSLESLHDPHTIRHLLSTGVGRGWRCLEIGGGSGSISQWLADRVGPEGHVLATDIDPRFLANSGRANLEVRRHDVGTDPLPESAFDLIHTRLVLIHVPQREATIGRLVSALKPGGWLVEGRLAEARRSAAPGATEAAGASARLYRDAAFYVPIGCRELKFKTETPPKAENNERDQYPILARRPPDQRR